MGRVVKGAAVGVLGAGMMIGGWDAGKHELGAAAVNYGYAAYGTDSGLGNAHALGKGAGEYVKLTAQNVCDNLPLWTPCDRKPNKINTNDHVVNAIGPEIASLGGAVGTGFGVWMVLGGILGAAKNRYNRGSQEAAGTAINDANY
ncbi:MAG: hypothetical protein WBP03_04165 [Candidatus Saccharimonadales bacterium]